MSEGPLFPFSEAMAAENTLLVTPRWRRWFLNLRNSVDLSQSVKKSLPLSNQNASIAVTSLDGGTLSAGLYVASWYMKVVTPAGVSSSAQITIAWVDHGDAKTYPAPAMTGNLSTTIQGDQRVMFYSDAASPITFAVTYASNPAGAMVYDLWMVLQAVGVAA